MTNNSFTSCNFPKKFPFSYLSIFTVTLFFEDFSLFDLFLHGEMQRQSQIVIKQKNASTGTKGPEFIYLESSNSFSMQFLKFRILIQMRNQYRQQLIYARQVHKIFFFFLLFRLHPSVHQDPQFHQQMCLAEPSLQLTVPTTGAYWHQINLSSDLMIRIS